jgi:RNA polymerase sigma factor (sigma-70 family)
MAEQNWNDDLIVEKINAGGLERNQVLSTFFKQEKLWNTVIQQVIKLGGSTAEAEDVFQEAVIIFDRNIRAGKFKGQSNLETYFVGIAKWFWIAQRRKKGRETELNPEIHDSQEDSHEYLVFEKDRKNLLNQALMQLGDRCIIILKLWAQSFSMKEIALQVDFTKDGQPDENRAKKEAYRCRKRLSAYVKSQPQLMQSLNALR